MMQGRAPVPARKDVVLALIAGDARAVLDQSLPEAEWLELLASLGDPLAAALQLEADVSGGHLGVAADLGEADVRSDFLADPALGRLELGAPGIRNRVHKADLCVAPGGRRWSHK